MDVTIAAPNVMLAAVLFDLDGTLVDPAGGITGGIEYALKVMGLPVPAPDALEAMIGPKLADALLAHANVPASRVSEAIGIYRSWYNEIGMGLSRPYPGMAELLKELRAQGILLGVATQKPEPLAKKLLGHHGLDTLFDVICGANPDETLMPGDPGYRQGKAEIIAAALEALNLAEEEVALMVGDRFQDVQGAQANGLGCIGVRWGFAAAGELETAGANAVVETIQELSVELANAGSASHTALESVHGAL